MKRISKKRHDRALRKELQFWYRPNILENQQFRTGRYLELIQNLEQQVGTKSIHHILDVGSGPACLAQHFSHGEKWFLDPLMDEYLSQFNQAIPRGHHISSTIEDAPLEPEFFDIIVCFNAFDHVQDPWKGLAKIYRLLKPEGVFLFTIYTRGVILAFLRNLQELFHLSTDVAHPYTFTKTRMEKDLKNTGFSIYKSHEIKQDKDRIEHAWFCFKHAQSADRDI
jgi:SAM-dependent methyltransferase